MNASQKKIDRITEVNAKMVSLKKISKGVYSSPDGRYVLTLTNTLNRGNRYGVYYWNCEDTTLREVTPYRHATLASLDVARKVFGMGIDPQDSSAVARLISFA